MLVCVYAHVGNKYTAKLFCDLRLPGFQQFFQGFHMTAILPSTIPIDGRPSGEAYVQFSDVNETWRALQTRNGARMDRRYIELFPASKQEMTFAAQGGDPRGRRLTDNRSSSTPSL